MSYVKLRALLLRTWSMAGEEEGQTVFEFALVVSLVALVAIVVLSALGLTVVDLFDPLAETIGG